MNDPAYNSQAFRDSPEGKQLYGKYIHITKSQRVGQFRDFQSFCEWAFASRYRYGYELMRWDTSQPASPENCFFYRMPQGSAFKTAEETLDFIWRWNRSVNPLRKLAGMEPLREATVCVARVGRTEIDIENGKDVVLYAESGSFGNGICTDDEGGGDAYG